MDFLEAVAPFHYNVPVMILVCYDVDVVWRNPGDHTINAVLRNIS